MLLNLLILVVFAAAQEEVPFARYTEKNTPQEKLPFESSTTSSTSLATVPFGNSVSKETNPTIIFKTPLPKEEEKEKLNLNWVYIALPLVLIFGMLVFIEMKRKKDHRGLMSQKKQYNTDSIRNYVSTNLRKGFSKEQIRNALIKNNYNNEEIGEAFRVLK